MKKILIAVAVITITGCKKLIDIPPPIDRITTETVFSNDQSAIAAIMGIYAQMNITTATIASGGTTIYAGLSADELDYTGTVADQLSINTNAVQPNNSLLGGDIWQRAYTHIYHINACIEGLKNSSSLTPALQQQLTAEAKFLRAFIYYYLVNFYGEVPLVKGTAYQENMLLPRAPVTNVYELIVEDLQQAKSVLPVGYTGTGKVRATKWAAGAMLARVYLHLQQWQLAEQETSVVISQSTFTLPVLNNVFLSGSSEAIWQLQPVVNNFNTTEGNKFIPSSATAKPAYVLTQSLLNAFETGDQRKTAWTKFNTVSAQQWYYPFKYKVRTGSTVTEYYVMLRLAEQYLLRAEARAEQNKLDEAKADINILRARASLPVTTANTKDAILTAIEREKRVELFAEWGHRWFDLKRRGRAGMLLQGLKPGWQHHDTLYPIPQSQLERNPALTQNPGY